MFDVGIWEIGVIGVVALVVLGPERLPKVARTAGHLFGRLQRYVANVKADINREMDASEFAKVKEEVQSAARSFEQSVQDHAKSIDSESREISALGNSIDGNAFTKSAANAQLPTPASATPALAHAPESQADILFSQEAGIPPPPVLIAQNDAPVIVAAKTPATNHVVLQSFDLGIEPPRLASRRTPS